MSNDDAIEKLIEALETVRARPSMYMGEATVDSAQGFVAGFEVACETLGIVKYYLELHREAVQRREWKWNATGGLDDMRERGLTEAQIADELLAIEIEILKIPPSSVPRDPQLALFCRFENGPAGMIKATNPVARQADLSVHAIS